MTQDGGGFLSCEYVDLEFLQGGGFLGASPRLVPFPSTFKTITDGQRVHSKIASDIVRHLVPPYFHFSFSKRITLSTVLPHFYFI